MAKIKIAQNPTFNAEVSIPRVGGTPEKVSFTFIYMDRVALSVLFDKWNKAREEYAAKVKEEGLTWREATASEIQLQVAQIKDIVSGWGFDDKFTDEAIAELVKTCIGTPQAVLDAYQGAYNPARLGN
jgi:hypothetical protein